MSTAHVPAAGLWRVGRSQEPIDFPDPPTGDELDLSRAGNRFDSPTEDFRTCYFATEPFACFGETLSRFRPNPALAEAAEEEGFMGIGQVPADWRHQRVLLRVELEPTVARPNLSFLDVEARQTRERLEEGMGAMLAYYGREDLDVATVRGDDRRITRWIAKAATTRSTRRGSEPSPAFAISRDSTRIGSAGRSFTMSACSKSSADRSCDSIRRSPRSQGTTASPCTDRRPAGRLPQLEPR